MRKAKLRTYGLAASIVALCAALPVSAQSDSLSSDLECLLGASVLAASEQDDVKAGGINAALFFSGKVFARDPNIDLEAALEKQAAVTDPATLSTVLTRCGTEMKARTEELSKAGRNLAAKRK